MKNILIIFFLFLYYNIVAQQRFPTGPPTQFSTGYFKQGYHQSDSGTIIANRDTNWLAKYSATIVFKPSNKQFYWFDSTTLTWNKFGNVIDTTPLHNQIVLKLNISDTIGKWLSQSTRLVDTMYRVNDSTIGYAIKGNPYSFQILGRSSGGGGGGSGTVTSVGLSLPAAFSVTPSTITTSGTFNVTGAGTSLQYIKGNGTLGTADTSMIPNFYLKARSLISGTSPITYNTTTGAVGINNGNASGNKGAVTFTSTFTDNGLGTIDLPNLVSIGSCTNCSVSFDAKGRATAYSNGAGPLSRAVDTISRTPGVDSIYFTINSVQYAIKDSTGVSGISLNNIGSGNRWLATPTGNFKTASGSNTITVDSSSNSNALTFKVDTSVIATQYDLTQAIPSWQQTLNVSPYHTSTLFYDTTMVSNPATHEWANYAPLVKTDTATNPFHQWQYSGTNNGSHNEVMFWGWNVGPGGGQYIVNRPALGESWESNYQINPDGNSDRLMEKHEIYVTPGGTQYRLSSYTINTNAGTINFYHTVDNFSLHTQSLTPYYSILGVGTTVSQTFVNPSDYNDYFGITSNFVQDTTTANFTISQSSGKPNNLFNVMGFTSSLLPSAAIYTPNYDGSEIELTGQTTGLLGKLLSDSSHTSLTTFTNVPIDFVDDGIRSLSLFKTKNKMAVPLAVNSNNFVSAPFAALESSANSSSLEAAGWFQNSSTTGTNYGVEVYAIGASGTNEAIYVSANNASTNRSIRIQFPSAGANNYAIYSDATAQSYHAGKFGIGIGVTAPDSTLQINGSFHNNAGVRMTGLPSAPGTKAVRIDANGNLSMADTSTASVTTLYTGDGTLAGNRTVTGGNNSLTFTGIFNYRVDANAFILAKSTPGLTYTTAVLGTDNRYEIGYTPTPTVYSKGAGITIDTNNNVSIGTGQILSTHPLYTYGSAFAQGFTSAQGNFYRVDTISVDQTVNIQSYWWDINAANNNVTITLPAASTAFGGKVGIQYVFRRIDASANTVTIQRNGTPGTDTINGASSFTLTAQYEVKEVQAVSTSAFAIK